MTLNDLMKKSDSDTSKTPSEKCKTSSRRPDVLHMTGYSGSEKGRTGCAGGAVGAGADAVVGDDRVDTDPNAALLVPASSDIPSAVIVDLPTRADGQAIAVPVASRHSRFKKSNLMSSSMYRKTRRRALFKNGECNIVLANVSKLRRRYMQDLFTTLVDAQWRWTLLVFCASFFLSWLVFAVVWYLIAYTHADLAEENVKNPAWSPCVINVHTLMGSFLFSVETQHTTGFGYRMITEECPEAVALFCLQSIAGLMIQAFMVGIVFAKMARPKQRCQTLMFSRNAVICRRDGQLCFMFRVGDVREKSHLIGTTIRTRFIRSRVTPEGETLSPNVTHLEVCVDDNDEQMFLMWPTVVVHKIDEKSPMYGLSAAALLNEKFEVAVVLEGTTESTGQTTQARTSYLASEVLWGHRFRPLVKFCKTKLSYEVDYSQFNDMCKVDTPLCSARDLETYLKINESNPPMM